MWVWESSILLVLAVVSECQVKFDYKASTRNDEVQETCTASNGKQGVCNEFRTTEHQECSFFPSSDTSDHADEHLTANICKNTGRELFFCCPSKITLPTADECKVSLSNNVVGGKATQAGAWPWLAAIGRMEGSVFTQFCGGSLITKQHVLTAAHCFKTRYEKEIVRLGEFDLDDDNDNALDFRIVNESTMIYFDKDSLENDIMILKLDKAVPKFTDNLRAACLPYHLLNYGFTGKVLTVVGWGVFHQIVHGNRVVVSISSPIPLKVSLPVVPLQECQATYKRVSTDRIFKIDDKQLCAGRGGGTDACNGDSGGPVHYLDLDKGLIYLVGLVSFGPTHCGERDIPGVFTRVGAFMDWIQDTVDILQ